MPTMNTTRTCLLVIAAAMVAACDRPPPSVDAGDEHLDGSSELVDAGTTDDAAADAGPRTCRAPCEGDTVCADGFCRSRPAGDFDPDCAANLTISTYPCVHLYDDWDYVGATVCNRGSGAIAAAQLVRFETEGATLCETTTTDAIDPGSCVQVTCALEDSTGRLAPSGLVRATVNPDGTTPECGDALDNTMEGDVAIGCE